MNLKTNNPLVSIVIPAHNAQKTLRNCLEAICNLSYRNFECIVVDNNSTDNTRKIVQEYCTKDRRFILFFEKEISRGAARNTGVKAAKGTIIASTDADCIVPRNWLNDLIPPIIEGQEVAVMGFEHDLIGNFWTKNTLAANNRFNHNNSHGNYINHVDTKNFAILSSILKEFKFNKKLICLEDFELYLRLKKHYRIAYNPNVSVGHCHESSIKDTIKTNFERAFWAAKVYLSAKNDPVIKTELMFSSFSLKNFFLFPLWMIFQLFKRPAQKLMFIFVQEISWRCGMLVGLTSNLFHHL